MKRYVFIFGALTGLLLSGGLLLAVPVLAQSVDMQQFAAEAGFVQADIRLVIARLIRTALTLLGILVVGFILYGGFLWMTAGGDTDRLKRAKQTLTNAVIGLVITLSAFAISQFVIGSLTKALGVGGISGTGDDGGGGFYGDPPGAVRRFVLTGWNEQCGGTIRNLELQLIFSQSVSTASVTDPNRAGIEVKDAGGARVDGTFTVAGKLVTFKPTAACPGIPTEKCFSENARYTVEMKPTVLKSSTGRTFDCGGAFGSCQLSFETGSTIDTAKPTMAMRRPDTNGGSGVVGDVVPLQAFAKDDGGVSTVSFFADSAKAVFVAGLEDSAAKRLSPENYFSTDATEWNTAAATPKTYRLWASGADCAGHTAVSPQVSFTLQGLSCGNGVKDGDETGLDCGGSCAACEGGACATSADCAAGLSCKDGTCQSVPRIDRVNPGDGAPENLITISGVGFGTEAGSVVFLGDPAVPEDDATLAPYAGCVGTWSPTQVIIQLPTTVKDGAIEVRTKSGASDRTNDAFGSRISDFDVNEIKRPGLCSIQPNTGTGSIQAAVAGNNLGASRGTSTVYFGNFAAAAYNVWSTGSARVTVPLLDPATYPVQAFVGDNVCAGTTTLCRSDADCQGGTCQMGRQGSNPVSYVAQALSQSTPPTISSVESGWRVCSQGSPNQGKHCLTDDECGGGTCVAAPDWGPPGQYVTVFGTNFGTTGSIRFRSKDNGQEALGDTLFPEQCSVAFWSNTSAIVKVPKAYLNSQSITTGAYELLVDRGGVKSAAVTFNVIDDQPGPGICRLEPSAGPVGTQVRMLGENFTGTLGRVVFNDKKEATFQSIDTGTLNATVPNDAKTGPVFVERASPSPARSNAVPFTVGSCKTTPNLCTSGQTCCADGTCAVSCAVPHISHYAYLFSTGPIPLAPRVRVACNTTEPVASPTPWEGWSQAANVCVNAVVGADFDLKMDRVGFQDNVLVGKCTASGGNPCSRTEATAGAITGDNDYSFRWVPSGNGGRFESNTTYQVTLRAAGLRSQSKIVNGVELGLIPMERDFSWRFTTAPQDAPCSIGSVIVSPNEALADEEGQETDYTADPVSASDRCVKIQCEVTTQMQWTSDYPSEAELVGRADTPLVCDERVRANVQPPGNKAKIRATITSASGRPSDVGTLTIDFIDPNVSESWPTCETACVNTAMGATFNTTMKEEDLLASGSVRLFKCENAVCDSTRLQEVSGIRVEYPGTPLVPKLSIIPTNVLTPDTYYRVVISGRVRSQSNIPLSVANNGGNYSWIFRTKNSSEPCAIDRVEVEPEEAVMTRVEARQEFRAVPYGAPDDCAVTGQPLNAGGYTWGAWQAVDAPDKVPDPVRVAAMINAGEIKLFPTDRLPQGCTTQCLNAGAAVTKDDAICGNGVAEKTKGEDCDDGNLRNGDGCSARCLTEPTLQCGKFCTGTNNACTVDTDCATGTTCENRTANCCGNGGAPEGHEECDPGSTSSESCTNECLNRGSTAFCGNGFVEEEAGEECDDRNTQNNDGCSSRCLREGSIAQTDVSAICGNGGAPEAGEDCDDGNATSGDGCSNRCVNEGTPACVNECVGGTSPGINCTTSAQCGGGGTCRPKIQPCCGNGGAPEAGEDCDGGAGCSNRCLKTGSSVSYPQPSFCGNQIRETGEECEVPLTASQATNGPYGVSQITQDAPQEVDPRTKRATANVSASVGGKSGSASLALSCSCTTDLSCGIGGTVGCGTNGCCFDRPRIGVVQPQSGAEGRCRNTAVSVDFTKRMDAASLDPSTDANNDRSISEAEYKPNLYLELVRLDGQTLTDVSCRAKGYRWTQVPLAGGSHCLLPVTYTVQPGSDGSRAYVNLSKLLEPAGEYRLVVLGDGNLSDAVKAGVLSSDQVSVDGSRWGIPGLNTVSQFTVGSEICEIESILVTDQGKLTAAGALVAPPANRSPRMFTKIGEQHSMTAAAYANSGEEIRPVAGAYDWSWGWGDNLPVQDRPNVVTTSTSTTSASTVTADKNNGDEIVLATTTITAPPAPTGQTAREVTGQLPVQAFLCENPSSTLYPYRDETGEKPTHFSFSYCRDAGGPGTPDDLPEMVTVPVPQPRSGLYKELLFSLAGTGDGLGVRVIGNPDYLPPERWYAEQGFNGSPTSTTVDGYEAVQDGTTWYVFAANQTSAGIYPNIYVISYNQNAKPDSKEAFNRILSTWKFNANLESTSTNLCKNASGYILKDGKYQGCSADRDCGTGAVCEAAKTKLRRDTKRLSDVIRIKNLIDRYGAVNRHCSITKNQVCLTNSQCPGSETCIPNVPDLASGSFIRVLSTSKWPSWAAALGNAVGSALPKDPLNTIVECPVKTAAGEATGYDADTCFNSQQTRFQCNPGSYLYGFRSSGGEAYTLYTQLEYKDGLWVEALDRSSTDPGTLLAEFYDNASMGATKTGFSRSASFCVGNPTGVSATCGDGVRGDTEVCEIGEVRAVACTNGTKNVTCINDGGTCRFQTADESTSACQPYSCGNGIVEPLATPSEQCDQGSRNGTYGATCSATCQLFTGAFYCGDGQLAGPEQCDLGSQNGQYVAARTSSCSYDCKVPGPSCGDGEVNGPEACDSNREESTQALCSNGKPCTQDSDCASGTCGAGGMACERKQVCVAGDPDKLGNICMDNTQCQASLCTKGDAAKLNTRCVTNAGCGTGGECKTVGTCSTQTYQTSRVRTCSTTACTWNGWSACQGGVQKCGNGVKEGVEECDDGNNKDTDGCTTQCKKNICGDGYTYLGIESCDRGADNGDDTKCTPAYGGTCNYCTAGCQYKTKTGAFCGDGKRSDIEFCDGADIPFACVKTVSGVLEEKGTCEVIDEGKTGVAASAPSGYKGCEEGYTCRKAGLCNGGLDNGKVCAVDVAPADSSGNTYACQNAPCIFPTCNADCRAACPFTFSTTALQLKRGDIIGGEPQNSIELYSFSGNKKPNVAALLVPACTVMEGIFADVERKNFQTPSLDIVFVTDRTGSMGGNDITVAKQSVVTAINTFFDAYQSLNRPIRIALVSYSKVLLDGAVVDKNFTGPEGRQSLIDTVNAYTASGTSTGNVALKKSLELFQASTAESKVMIVLTDGDMTNQVFRDGAWSSVTTAEGKFITMDVLRQHEPAVAGQFIDQAKDIKVYTAAITTNRNVKSFMRHLSKDYCPPADYSWTSGAYPSYTSATGCSTNQDDNTEYAYAGSTSEQIRAMYQQITDNILGIVLSFVSNLDGTTVRSPGNVEEGKSQPLPVPAGFSCTSASSLLPFTVTVDSDEATIAFDKFKMTYCPTQ